MGQEVTLISVGSLPVGLNVQGAAGSPKDDDVTGQNSESGHVWIAT